MDVVLIFVAGYALGAILMAVVMAVFPGRTRRRAAEAELPAEPAFAP